AQAPLNDLESGGFRPRSPTASGAGLTLESNGMSFRTIGESRCLMCPASRMGAVLGAAILAQCPGDRIVGQTVLKDSAGMVENDAVRLAGSRAQSAPDHLPE